MSKSDFLNYEVILKIVTPVHIGGTSDGELNKADYVRDEHKSMIRVIDNQKFAKHLSSRGLIETYADYIGKNVGAYQRNSLDLQDFIKRYCNLSPSMQKQMYKISIPIPKGIKNVNDVSLFTRNGMDELFIPGSSIKGAIRNYIISASVKKDNS